MTRKSLDFYHAIRLDLTKCTGCTKCVRVCPTKALRVRLGKVELDASRCLDCGKCVLECPFEAIKPVADDLHSIHKYKYKLAILSTSFAGQFPSHIGYGAAKKALLQIGFDEVAEESMVTVMMSGFICDYIKKHQQQRPIISSDCPSIVRLIQYRFPSLLPNVLHLENPLNMLSIYFRGKICAERNLPKNEVGIFLIVPCIAQVVAVHQPEGSLEKLADGAISIQEVYCEIIKDLMKKNNSTSEDDIKIYPKGLSWAISGMEAEEVRDENLKTMAVSGIDNVIKILAKIENQQIEQFDYIVMSSCINGCVGGNLNKEDPFIATSRIRSLLKNAPDIEFDNQYFTAKYLSGKFNVPHLKPRSIMALDKDIKTALNKFARIDEILKKLPGLDCSACGSPTCKTLAEDIVEGKAQLSDCVVLQRQKTT